MVIPEGQVLVHGLDNFSIQFWVLLSKRSDGEASRLLGLVLKHGDEKTRRLARTFYEPVLTTDLGYYEMEVYQAIMIPFRFSLIHNEHVVQNYEKMLGESPEFRYYCACAFLICGQCSLTNQCAFGKLSDYELEALVAKMHRLGEDALAPAINKCLKCLGSAPELLKSLVQQKADESYIQLVWDSVQNGRARAIQCYCCAAPLAVLKRLTYEQDIPVEEAKRLLSVVAGFQCGNEDISKEAHCLHAVM